jgi:signal transduction histidine kinase
MNVSSADLELIGSAVINAFEQSAHGLGIIIKLESEGRKVMLLEKISHTPPCEKNLAALNGQLNISIAHFDKGKYVIADSEREIEEKSIVWEKENDKLGKVDLSKLPFSSSLKEIEERIQFENVLRQAKEDAEKAHRTKSIFLENISQELKMPVDGIIGFIDLLFQTYLDESQKEILRLMQNSSKSILSILNDVVDAAEIYGGAFTLQKHLFDFHEVVFDVADMINLLCLSKDIDLDVVLRGDVPQYVLGDAVRLKQILSNVLTNAAKYSDEGFVKLTVSYCENLKVFKIIVQDSGKGIPDADLSKIFTRFSRMENNLSTKEGQGAGLGLAMSKALAHLMNGSIEVSSVLGKGSEFVIQVQLDPVEQQYPSTMYFTFYA